MQTKIDAAELSETYLSALCIWREMRGRTAAERLGCYWVIRNRANDPMRRWPKSLAGVITQKRQFSSFNPDDPNAAAWPIANGSPDWLAFCEIAGMLEGELAPDPTGGANCYENLPDATPKRPAWADPAKLTKAIGDTRFYRL